MIGPDDPVDLNCHDEKQGSSWGCRRCAGRLAVLRPEYLFLLHSALYLPLDGQQSAGGNSNIWGFAAASLLMLAAVVMHFNAHKKGDGRISRSDGGSSIALALGTFRACPEVPAPRYQAAT